jgi:hypothetical protein
MPYQQPASAVVNQSSGSLTNYPCLPNDQWINNHGNTCAELATNPDAKPNWELWTCRAGCCECRPHRKSGRPVL